MPSRGFLSLQFMIPSKRFDIFVPLTGGCSESLHAFSFFFKRCYQYCYMYLKKNQSTPRPSEHPLVMGENMSKRLGGIKRLQIQNHFMAFKQVP